MTERTDFATLAAVLRGAATPTLTMEDFGRAMQVAHENAPNLDDYRAGRASLAPRPAFLCHRCHDLGWVSDWANWPVGWAWQRVEPVPRKACPDCTVGS